MNRIYAIVDGGVVVNCIVAESWEGGVDVTDKMPRPGPGWAYSDGEFSPPKPAEPPAPATRRITRLAFRNRFTLAELTGIEIACLDIPTAAPAQRQQAAALRVMQRQVDTATYIDLDRADTRAGVQQLEAMGVIGAGRALEILDAPIQPTEAA